MKKKILVFGHTGNLGSNFIYFLRDKYKFFLNVNKNKNYILGAEYVSFHKKSFLSFDNKYIKNKIKRLAPDIILNCAAHTNLDLCQKRPDLTSFVNIHLPTKLSEVCKELNIKFVHISTDHLYNQIKKFKNEKFPLSKINNYGGQKIEAENAIIKKNSNSLIIRTNFFSHSSNPNHFVNKIIDAIINYKKISLFNDYFFTPIYSKYLSNIIDYLIDNKLEGIFNIVSDERVSKYDFGKLFLKSLKIKKNSFIASSIKNAKLHTRRCLDLSLSNSKLKEKIKFKIPSLEKQVDEFIKDYKTINKKLFINLPYGKHSINKSDIFSVKKVLLSGSLTQGRFISELEERISEYVGAKYSVAVSSATAGLHLSYKAINIDKNNRIITSPNTFVSTSNSALFCNSLPSFSDISNETLGICPEILMENLKTEKKIKAIVPVHFGGLARDSKKYFDIAKKKNLKIVEDAAHALGAKYECGAKVGSCKYSDLTVFSFHPVKILAGGEGGIITTNDKKLYQTLISLRSHGIKKDGVINNKTAGFSKNKKNIWYYEMSNLGYHYRQTDIHSGLILSQLNRIESFLNKRNKLTKIYDEKFSNLKNLTTTQSQYRNLSSNHLYVIRLNFKKLKLNRNEFMNQLRKYKIISQVHYIPVPMQIYYKNLGYKMKNLENTKKYYDECISIPLFYDLSFDQQQYVVNSIKELII